MPVSTAPAPASLPAVGAPAPDLVADADTGERITLGAFRGRPVVVYFYPRDDTPSCTAEACGFRDDFARFAAHDAVVLGISPDGVPSHARFREKHALPFPLLADPDHAIAEAWGVWQEKSMYGRRYMGVVRTTFLIGRDGRVARVWERVRSAGHAVQVAEALDALMDEGTGGDGGARG